ncbi:neuraminidase-like domain-containing protein [Pseudomonas koreensis]|uniref:Neuraminidase-like domain-containing protein n=1 Tax=Pseudomonas koreensis TaxID=198620 RepID=A0A9X2XFX1_9PSED|nr:neuraminidase-like domain-containing protein [Pseudomonas koreensis]MCU7248439.1 neuraminidase-like domain-containing protein [Pseudomonas koreensis]
MASIGNIGGLQEKRRQALLAYAIGQLRKDNVKKYPFARTPADMLELLRLDTLDSHAVQSSWVAEATSCVQQYIRAVYHKLEPGFEDTEFEPKDLEAWKFSADYSTWAAVKILQTYPENVVQPSVRIGKTSLFKTFENDLNQTRLTTDSVQTAMQAYLEAFVKICDLEMISAYMHGVSPELAVYYFISRTRSSPPQYFWRKAEVEVGATETALNPAAWSDPLPVEVAVDAQVLDMRLVVWNGRLCVVWATWRDRVEHKDEFLPDKLDVYLALKRQNDQWSPPTTLLTREFQEKTSPVGARLIVTVWTDYQMPKGKLGVLLTNEKTGVGAIRESVVRDVFLRAIAHDDGAWLEHVASDRFTGIDMIQHPLMNQPQVVASDAPAGALTDFLGLHATAHRVGSDDVLIVQGYCWSTRLSGADVSLTLALQGALPGDPAPQTADYPRAGGWSSVSQVFTRAKGSWTQPVVFTFGSTTQGTKRFEVRVRDLTDFVVPTLLKNTRNAAQFLSFNQAHLALKFTRLNTLFSAELVARASISVDAVLDWFTQFLEEPGPSSAPFVETNGMFDSANGRNAWELFFHMAHLVATRLRDEQRFQEALDWLNYLFDPQGPADPDDPPVDNPRPPYWRCRALHGDGNPGHEAWRPMDPDAICYGTPRHYQILVFCEYVQTLIAKGDWHYRQLTRDSLVAARLCYVHAEFLMGRQPSVRAVNRWQTIRLDDLLTASESRPRLEAFESALAFNLGDFPLATDADARSGLLGSEIFINPLNEQLLRLYALPGERLDNLRNNRSIDGTPLLIDLFSPPADPGQLLLDLASGNSGTPRAMGGRLKVIAFRWRMSFEVGMRAAQMLSDFGAQVLSLMQQADQAELQETQQQQLVELGDFAQRMQEQTLEQLRLQVTALEQSRAVAQERAVAYEQRYVEDVSAVEYEVMDKIQLSKELSLIASSIKPVGAAIAALPKIFGLANGGHQIDKVTDAVVFGLNVAASVQQMEADKQSATEAYRRRRNDWGLQRDQALAEVRALNVQISAQRQSVLAAETHLEQTLRGNAHALTLYNFLKKRATRAELFRWMLGQLKALQYQAHDAVVSLCRSAQASMSAETGDFDSPRPLPQVWLDPRHGLTSGEHLRMWLLGMEHDYMQRYQRRLELRKTVSLRQLFNDTVEPQFALYNWDEALAQLKSKGTLDFCLTQLLFDRDHPGHYCRQISSVMVHLPVMKGAYQDVHATLVQISSRIATRATAQSVAHLHQPTGSVAPADVLINLLASQSIVVSTGIADNGLTGQKPEEGLLNPFENTGAVSCWQLKFPWPLKAPQSAMLASLTDIILEICFTARAGEPTFTRQVEDMVTLAENPGKNQKRKGESRHV